VFRIVQEDARPLCPESGSWGEIAYIQPLDGVMRIGEALLEVVPGITDHRFVVIPQGIPILKPIYDEIDVLIVP
jgi:hypothetical protein